MVRDTAFERPDVSAVALPDRPGPERGGLRSALARWETAVLAVLALTVVVAGVFVDGFATQRNAGFLLLDVIAIGLLALPLTLIIITGEIDLSIASMLGLCSATMGWLWLEGLPIETIIPLCIALGAVLGVINGLFVTVLGLPSLAVTIGTLALYRGLAFVVLGNQAVADFPRSFTSLATGKIGWIPYSVLPLVFLAVVFAILLHFTPFGRSLYVIGYNREAAAFSGIPVLRTKFLLFVASGAMAGFAGVFWTLRFASARGDNATGLELAVVAAVLLGGVSIFGGKGALHGVLAGVLLMGALRNALQLANVSADVLSMVTGLLLIASVVIPNIALRIREASRRRALATVPRTDKSPASWQPPGAEDRKD
ncbi:MAG TPA: ABC transporter permease [Jiangellaceae bacterium]